MDTMRTGILGSTLTAGVLLLGLSMVSAPAVAQTFSCDAGRMYSIRYVSRTVNAIDTITGSSIAGNLAILPAPPSGANWNGMGVEGGGSRIYAVASFGTGAGQVLVYNVSSGTSTISLVPNSAGYSGGFPAGGVNPVTGWFYAATPVTPSAGNTEWVLYAYNPAWGSSQAPIQVGRINAMENNGDLAFDALGNLYLLSGNIAGSGARIYRVNGPIPQTAGTATLASTVIAGPFTHGNANYSGIAYSNGLLVLQVGVANEVDSSTYYRIDPATGALVGSAFTAHGGADLASCQYPNTIRLLKDLPDGRLVAGNQFTLSITGGGVTLANTATTTGATSGVQSAAAGPVLGQSGTTYTVTETAAGSPVTVMANYAKSLQCENRVGNATTGTPVTVTPNAAGTSGTFVMPNSGGAGSNILCTFTNSRITTLTLQKTWSGAQLNDAVTVSVTNPAGVGTSLNAVANTAGETDTGVAFAVTRGTTYTLTENFTVGAATNYAKALTCTGNTGTGAAVTYTANALSGTVTVGSTASNLVCTFANTRRVTDLSIQKTATPNPVVSGAQIVFTLVITNHGPLAADGATVRDPAAAGLDCLAAGLPAPTCTASGSASCPAALTAASLHAGVAIPTLPNGGVVTLGVTCRVTASGF